MTEAEPPVPDIPPAPPVDAGNAAGAPTTGATVLAGGLWYSVSLLVPQLYTLVISVTAARVLGVDLFGRQSFIGFAEVSVGLLFTGGVPFALVHFVADRVGRGRSESVHQILRLALRLELAGAAIGATALVVASRFTHEHRGAWMLAAVAAFAAIVHTVPTSLLAGLQRFREASMVGITTGAVATVATVAVLLAGLGIEGMFAVEAAAGVVNVLWTGALARRVLAEVPVTGVPEQGLQRSVLRYAGVASASVILNFIVFRRTEFFFLNRYASDAEIGIYSVTFAAITAVGRVPDAISTVVFPAFSALSGAGDEARIRSGFSRLLRLLLLLAIPVTAGVVAVGPGALRAVYGPDYSRAGTVLVVMMLAFPILPLTTAGMSLATGLGSQRVPLAWAGLGAVVNVALDFLLIPHHGAVGAAIANVGAQLTAGVPALVHALRLTGGVEWVWSPVVRVALAAVAAGAAARGAVVLVDGAPGVLLGMVLGSSAFVLVGRAVHVLEVDGEWLRDSIGDRANGWVGRAISVFA
jgi:O-antigen/teichoic acid export membrane protein